MLFFLASLCGPMLAGGKGTKFSTKHMITGNYTVTVLKNGVETGQMFKGAFITKNGTTTGILNQVEEYITSENKTDYKILGSRNVELFADNDEHFKIVLDGQTYLEGKVTLDKDENVYKFAQENATTIIKVTVYNGLYTVITRIDKASKDQFEIKLRKDRQINKSNKMMLAMQPLMLLGNFFMQRKLKNKNLNRINQMEQQLQQPQDIVQNKEDTNAELAKDNEGDDKKKEEEQEGEAEDDKKED